MALRVLYFGTYDRDYSRNRILIDGLRQAGAVVLECHATLWASTDDKVAAAAGRWPRMILRAVSAYLQLLRAYWPVRRNYDVMVLGYTGQFDVFPARLLTWLARRPLVLDIFISLYLTSRERDLHLQHVLKWLEHMAFRLPDLLLVEADEYGTWVKSTFHLRAANLLSVPLGADPKRFDPALTRPPRRLLGQPFLVLYYGKYIPLHGVEYIIEAADLLRDSSAIEFELVGRGPTRARAEALAQEKHLANVKFTDWIEPAELPNYAARADILLGVFANSVQSTHIVPNKVYEALALGRPIVTGDSETSRSRFTNGQHALLIERCNPRALAEAIAKLSRDPELCERLALDGRRQFEAHFTPTVLGNRLFERLCQLCPERV